jgi:hypothetical protein
MKRVIMATILVLMISLPLYAGNKEECEQWCRSNTGCEKCSELVGCGTGYKSMKHFRGPGKNWHACQKTAFREAGEENQKSCEDYCKQSWTDCGKCSDKLGCGQGWLQIRAFTGPGKNWYACRESSWTVHSRYNRNDCKEWCEKNPNCEKCSDTKGCGIGYEWIAHFDQREVAAERWYACRNKDRKVDPPINKATCETYCTQPWKWCICTDKPTCPSGYKLSGDRFLEWRGCIETSKKIVSDNNRDECKEWCEKNENCAKCSSLRGCGIGYTALKEFGMIHKWFSCKKR